MQLSSCVPWLAQTGTIPQKQQLMEELAKFASWREQAGERGDEKEGLRVSSSSLLSCPLCLSFAQ